MDYIYSILSGYGAATRERSFLSVLDRFLSVLNKTFQSTKTTVSMDKYFLVFFHSDYSEKQSDYVFVTVFN